MTFTITANWNTFVFGFIWNTYEVVAALHFGPFIFAFVTDD